eukprot:749934-Hanusia_phi.AAC.1
MRETVAVTVRAPAIWHDSMIGPYRTNDARTGPALFTGFRGARAPGRYRRPCTVLSPGPPGRRITGPRRRSDP